ncbi:MAG TPA: SDR family oxidoreductase [Anaerolineales bacterium]|nr:SDR family oxidoreductase [Anaerolineales bacterium]HNN13443.1 SDR family oxidoreductase [Anaerolineales bacterium]HNO30766.1 SDR family oxidoreductase [Anaerolineales bacterium]
MTENKTAIVTAAGKGMGAAIAKELAANNYNLALMSPSGGAEELANSLGMIGLTGSVTEPGDLQKLVDMTMQKYGRIDAVVNHTGHPPKGPLLDIPDADWHKGMDVLLLNVVRMARLVTPIMLEQGGGVFVNISTYAVFEPEALFPVSGALRAALAAFTKVYSDQYSAKGIRMNNVLPGFVNSLAETEERRNRIPMGRYGTVEEIAKTVRFLLSADAGYITGQNIRVDGGITRSV